MRKKYLPRSGAYGRGPAAAWKRARALFRLVMLAPALSLVAAAAQAALTVTPITWDVVGLDSNRPVTSGPDLFPVAARVCSDSPTPNPVQVDLVWDDPDDSWIFSRTGSQTTLTFAPLGAGECVEAYYEIQVTRDPGAFEQSRRYRILAGDGVDSAESPSPRAIYVERLVSQNRNTTLLIRSGQQADQSDWQALGAGGALNLLINETYFIELTTETATAYEQVQSFLTLSNTIFQVLSASTTYSTRTAPLSRVPDPNPSLYADGCLWEPDLDSPNWLSCLSDGKAGGTVVSTYQIRIISGGGDSVGLEALIYDVSGSSFHYNVDFSQSPGDLNTVDPTAVGFAKRFLPDTVSVGVASRLLFTIENPNPIPLSGYSFTDNLPAGVEVASPANASTSCGGTWNPLPAATSVSFDIGGDFIPAGSTCSIRVDVTAPEGVYNNVSENLFIDGIDSGLNATDTLTVNNAPRPAACVPGTELARWTMAPAQGTGVPPAPDTVHPDATATASFTLDPTNPNSAHSIDTVTGQPVNAWSGIGWGPATSPDAGTGPGPNDSAYFEFQLDTDAFATDPAEPLTLSLDANPDGGGAWSSNANITMNVHVSADSGAFTTELNDATIDKSTWQSRSVDFTPGLADTVIRVNISGVSTNAQGDTAPFLLDNIVFTGCGPGDPAAILDPPTLSKSFSPNPIGAGEISTLTFSIGNPNAGDALSGISFDDTLPDGVVIATPGNAANGCGGTWAAPAGGSAVSLSGGALAGGANCTVSVDVTASGAGDYINISGFIFADESGENATATGSAEDTLTVLAPPQIEKRFESSLLLLGVDEPDVSFLRFTVENPNAGDAIADVAFSDVFPAGLVVADPQSGPAELSVTKTLVAQSDDPVILGTTLMYEIVVTNDDPGTLTGVTVADSLVTVDPLLDCSWPTAPGQLLVGESAVCSIDYVVSQSDLDAGQVVNLASATSAQTGAAEARYRLLTPLADSGCIGGTWSPVIGAGSVTLSGVTIAPGGSCEVGVWVSGPLGVYDNLSTAVSHAVGGVTVDGNTADARLVIDDPIPEIALLKQVGLTSDPDGAWSNYLAVEAPQDVYYRLTVENVGETELTGVAVSDPTVDASGCTWPMTLPVADFANPVAHIAVCVVGPVSITSPGAVPNTATASAASPSGNVQDMDSATVATASLGLVKTADLTTFAAAGETINYTFTVTNDGAAVLSGPVTISDALVPGAACPALVTIGDFDNFFDPGESLQCAGSYTTTATDVSNGQVQNMAVAGTPEVDSPPDTETVPLGIAALTIAKTQTSGPNPATAAGDMLGYQIVVTNSGNVSQTGVSVTDTLPDGSPGTLSGPTESITANGVLEVGETFTYTVGYTVTQADIDAGATLVNTASVSTDQVPGPTMDTAPTPVTAGPALTIAKTQTSGPNPATAAGDVLGYQIVVTNSGNVSQTGVSVTDTLPDGSPGTLSGPTESITANGVLEVGETFTYTVGYTVTQADIDAGATLVNTASVSTDQVPGPTMDTAPTPVTAGPALTIAKTQTSGPNPATAAGDVLGYQIVVTNSGNVSQTGVSVTDTLPDGSPGTLSGPTESITANGVLEVGETFTYTVGYTVTQADIDAGATLVNTASVSTDQVPGPTMDTAPTPVTAGPALTIAKTQTSGPNPATAAGDVLGYDIVVSNTGTVNQTGVSVTDTLPDGSPGTLSGPTESITANGVLEVGETFTYTVGYTVTQADIDAGATLVNTASVSTDQVPGPTMDTAPTPVTAGPALTIAKTQTSGPNPATAAGDVLGYDIVVSNTGTVNQTGVSVTDTLPDGSPGTLSGPTESITANGVLEVGETFTYTVGYTVTQADIDAGATLVNTASVSTDQVPGPTMDTAPTPVTAGPALTIAKTQTSGPNPATAAGDVLGYDIVVSNTGTVNQTGVSVTDTLPDGSPGTLAGPTESLTVNGVLEVGETFTYTVGYTVTQADIDAGATLVNTASVSTDQVPGPTMDTAPTPVSSVTPAVAVTKSASPSPGSPVLPGQTLDYTLTVTVSGAPLTDIVEITDTMGAGLSFGTVIDAGSFLTDTAANPLLFSLPSGTAPGSYVVRYTAVVDPNAASLVDNRAIVSGDGGDPDPDCNDCSTSHPLGTPPPTAVPVNSAWSVLTLLILVLATAGLRLTTTDSGRTRRHSG